MIDEISRDKFSTKADGEAALPEAQRIVGGTIEQRRRPDTYTARVTDAIPLSMQKAKRWVTWRLEPSQNNLTDTTKVPYCAATGKHASTTDPRTWGRFQDVLTAVERLRVDAEAVRRKPDSLSKGIGFMMLNSGVVGVDIDHCINDDGTLTDVARDIVNTLDSYTELSPSGKGIRIFVDACTLPGKDFTRRNGLEMYGGSSGRYLTVTGNIFEWRADLREASAQNDVNTIYNRYKPERQQAATAPATLPAAKTVPAPAPKTGAQLSRIDAAREVNARWRELILLLSPGYAPKPRNGEPSYICPICGRPDSNSAHGDGLTFFPRSQANTLHCFRTSCFTGSILDLWQQVKSVDFDDALDRTCEILGVNVVARGMYSDVLDWGDTIEDGQEPIPDAAEATSKPEQAADYTAYYEQCRARLDNPTVTTYLGARGFSLGTAKKYGWGYDPHADPACNPGGKVAGKYPVPRLIIPITKGFYTGRKLASGEDRYRDTPGTAPVWNMDALYKPDAKAVFVTEGIFDAAAIIEAGYNAIALHNVNSRELVRQLKARPTKATLILALDNDVPGQTGSQPKLAELARAKCKAYSRNVCCGYKDPAEAWQFAPEELKAELAEATANALKPDAVTQYLFSARMYEDMDAYKTERKTGFANLDEKSGGLFAGLYFLAAIPSLGKTTFVHQMADNLAAAGHDVLFFSLEQSRLELISKSLARTLAQDDPCSGITSISIRKGYNVDAVISAGEKYIKAVGDRLSVIEGNFNVNADTIMREVTSYIHRTGVTPVVVIDYLQILQPMDVDAKNRITGIRETIDHSVTALKRFSRDNNLTVIVISSVNRANYLAPISYEAFKESGCIEYSADVVYGLQLACLNDPIFQEAEKKLIEKRKTVEQAKKAVPRRIELKCLKNRFGVTSFSCFFKYNPMQDLFAVDTDIIAPGEKAFDDEIKDDYVPLAKRQNLF